MPTYFCFRYLKFKHAKHIEHLDLSSAYRVYFYRVMHFSAKRYWDCLLSVCLSPIKTETTCINLLYANKTPPLITGDNTFGRMLSHSSTSPRLGSLRLLFCFCWLHLLELWLAVEVAAAGVTCSALPAVTSQTSHFTVHWRNWSSPISRVQKHLSAHQYFHTTVRF